MQVVLLQDVAKIGKKYETKNVADGYALNFLIPNKMAKLATANVIKDLELAKIKQKEQEEMEGKELIENIKELKDSIINIEVKVNKEGNLFAGIDKEDIIAIIKDQKALDINADNIILEKPIKTASEHKIKIQVGDETAEFKLNIISSK